MVGLAGLEPALLTEADFLTTIVFTTHFWFVVWTIPSPFFGRGFPSSLYTRPIDIIYLLGSVLPFYRVYRVWKHPIFNYSNMAQLLKSAVFTISP